MREVLTTGLDIIGLFAIVAGVAFIFWPAALIVLGAGCILVSRVATR